MKRGAKTLYPLMDMKGGLKPSILGQTLGSSLGKS